MTLLKKFYHLRDYNFLTCKNISVALIQPNLSRTNLLGDEQLEEAQRSKSCVNLVLRESDSAGDLKSVSGSRPDSFVSIPNEGTGRSIDSSWGSGDLETR